MENQEQVKDYWKKKSQEIGEEILYKSIAQCYQRGQSERIGILFLTESYLVFEYSKLPRKTLLESLFTRSQGGELDQVIRIDRKNIRMAELLTLNQAKKWLRRDYSPLEILTSSKFHKTSPLLALLAGTCVGMCTEDIFLAFNTPVNREWVELLNRAL